MKVRWREHEAVLITIIALIATAGYIRIMYLLTPVQITAMQQAFEQNHVSYNYFSHVLLPQIGCIIILWLCYMWINRSIVPQLTMPVKRWLFTPLLVVLQLLFIFYILGPGVNFLSFYLAPYGGQDFFRPPGTFGYHPQPFQNLFGGLGVVIFFGCLYALYVIVRERIIHLLEKNKTRSAYYIMISNQTTQSLVIMFAIPVFATVFNLVPNPAYYTYYFAFFPAVYAVFTTNIYYLFPKNGDEPVINRQSWGPLLFTTFVYTVLFSIFLKDEWSFGLVFSFWLAQLFIITPLSWLDYRQKKDKIIQLRGIEEALVKSTADLQFLRSQINPHFLFNALNTLYGTALLEGSKNTAEGIQKLGDMMRFMLHDNTMDFIPMEREIEYLKNYISLQRLRTQLSPDIAIEDAITNDECNHAIGPMLLIPFVENAFKHGVSLTERSWIKIKLECDKQGIFFEVRNSVHATSVNDPEKNSSGIGLKNVKERLQLMYPGLHEFNYGVAGSEFVASLTLREGEHRKVFRKEIRFWGKGKGEEKGER